MANRMTLKLTIENMESTILSSPRSDNYTRYEALNLYLAELCVEWNGKHQWMLEVVPYGEYTVATGSLSVWCSYCGLDATWFVGTDEYDYFVNCDIGLMPIRDGRHMSLMDMLIPVEIEVEHIKMWTDYGYEYDISVQVYPWGEDNDLFEQLTGRRW